MKDNMENKPTEIKFIKFLCVNDYEVPDAWYRGEGKTASVIGLNTDHEWVYVMPRIEKNLAEYVTDALNSYVGN